MNAAGQPVVWTEEDSVSTTSVELRCCHGVVVVRPGDDLLVANGLDLDESGDFIDELRRLIPGVNVVMISGDVQLAVRRPLDNDA